MLVDYVSQWRALLGKICARVGEDLTVSRLHEQVMGTTRQTVGQIRDSSLHQQVTVTSGNEMHSGRIRKCAGRLRQPVTGTIRKKGGQSKKGSDGE